MEDKGILHANSFTPSAIVPPSKATLHVQGGPLSGPETKSLFSMNKKTSKDTEEQFLMSLILPRISKSINGTIEFNNLFIPPPPAAKLSTLLDPPSLSPTKSVTSQSPTHKRVTGTTTDNKKKPSSPEISKSKSTTKKKPTKIPDKDSLLHCKQDRFCPPGQLTYAPFDVLSL
jgi:hypothetical protein